MRGLIIETINPDDIQSLRRLRATEGYLELGMFEEAEEELRQLDPAWLHLGPIARLQLRVLAGLNSV